MPSGQSPFHQRSGRTLSERLAFYSIPEPNSGCLLWTGCCLKAGYGYLNKWEAGASSKVLVHRLAWELANNRKIPAGLVVRHKCDVPLCINPSHLEIGTYRDNTHDALKRGRKGRLSAQDTRDIFLDKRPQKEIAAEYGVTGSHISRIKGGKVSRYATESMIGKIAR